MKKINKFIKSILERDDFIFIVTAIFWGIILSGIKIAIDDEALMASKKAFSTFEAFENEMKNWFVWSSRWLVNFIASRLLAYPRWLWCIYMGISMFVLQKAISLLFVTKNKSAWNLFVAFLVCIMPWTQITTAGWICTTATYFGPLAFGIMGLVPIAKTIRKEKMLNIEKVFYSIALFYGTNIEQMMVVGVGCYFAALIYLIYEKKEIRYIIINFLVTLVELANFLFCPGNSNRSLEEAADWFPNYGMMDFIDKADIGLFSTLGNIFLENSYLFILIILFILTCLIIRKTNDTKYRMIGSYSFVILVIIGPLREVMWKFFPDLQYLTASIDTQGLVNVSNVKNVLTFFQYSFIMSIMFGVVLSIALVSDKIIHFAIDMCILMLGLASRVAIGFSPTVYASSTRTFEMLFICIIMVGVHIAVNNIEIEQMSAKKVKVVKIVMISAIILSLWEMAGLVGARFLIC